MKLTIKFSTINIVILSEICYSLSTFAESYKKEVLSNIYKIQKLYYENTDATLFNYSMNPLKIEELLISNDYVRPLFDHYFNWRTSREGYWYWSNISDIILNVYKKNYETNN